MTAFNTTTRGGPFLPILAATLLLILSACEAPENADGDASTDAGESAERENWKLVQAYIDLDEAWHARENKIRQSDIPAEEKERLRKEERGEHPDIVLAVVAARAIAGGEGERAVDAAKFLMEQTRDLSPTAASDMEFGNAALQRLVGPDWSVVEAHNEALKAWKEDDEARREEFTSQDAESKQPFTFIPPPDGMLAMAAAQAILESGSGHEKAREAAEFLIEQGMGNPNGMLNGARALAGSAPDFDDWPNVLMRLDSVRARGKGEAFDEFLAGMASGANDPVVRATARYFRAKGLADSMNDPSMDSAEREAQRQRALDIATGLSAGVEAEEFVKKASDDVEQVTRTLADAEAALVHGIRHTVVGATVANEAGKRLDGAEDNLSAYAGKVLLLDFWATWCGPCIAALPKLRELAEGYSEDRFEILGISVDAEVETVTDFLEDQPMPWAHWHIGVGSDLGMSWHIAGYPTYVVIGQDGVILSRGHDLDAAAQVIERAVNGEA